MTEPSTPTQYGKLIRRQTPPDPPASNSEDELDSLLTALKDRQGQNANEKVALKHDPVQALRHLTLNELIPVFVDLVEKYSKTGISMQMDASNFLEGGREIRFEFGIGEHRTQLLGTVTTEAIAFHETRFSPDVLGELVSGPMLRLHHLDGETFRNFVCERMAILLRDAMRRR